MEMKVTQIPETNESFDYTLIRFTLQEVIKMMLSLKMDLNNYFSHEFLGKLNNSPFATFNLLYQINAVIAISDSPYKVIQLGFVKDGYLIKDVTDLPDTDWYLAKPLEYETLKLLIPERFEEVYILKNTYVSDSLIDAIHSFKMVRQGVFVHDFTSNNQCGFVGNTEYHYKFIGLFETEFNGLDDHGFLIDHSKIHEIIINSLPEVGLSCEEMHMVIIDHLIREFGKLSISVNSFKFSLIPTGNSVQDFKAKAYLTSYVGNSSFFGLLTDDGMFGSNSEIAD